MRLENPAQSAAESWRLHGTLVGFLDKLRFSLVKKSDQSESVRTRRRNKILFLLLMLYRVSIDIRGHKEVTYLSSLKDLEKEIHVLSD